MIIMDKVCEYILKNLDKTLRFNPEDRGTLIGVPMPYNVPCMKQTFNELYYWDTYFLNKGLIAAGNVEQAKNNCLDVKFLIDKFGYMPNGNRTFFLEDSAFYGCSSLKAAVLPISVKSIGSSSFEGCSSMDKVEIFGKLRVLGSSAFSGCRALTDISFDAENGFTVSDYAFFGCQSLQSFKLPDGTERIGEHAFV